jgi:hypothetical protein
MNIDTLLVGSVPIMVVIFGLVEFSKSLGVSGKWLTGLSLFTGLLFGLGYHIYAAGVPLGFSAWFEAVIFGLALGLVASGFYDFANSRWPTSRGDLKSPSADLTPRGVNKAP